MLDKSPVDGTIFEGYETIIFDLDDTLWTVYRADGTVSKALFTVPPFKLQDQDTVTDIQGSVVRLQEGVQGLLELLDKDNKNLGIVSWSELKQMAFEAQPAVMLLKKFDIYKYFNYEVVLRLGEDKSLFVKPKGKTLFIDDDKTQTDAVNQKGEADVLLRGAFESWRDLLSAKTASFKDQLIEKRAGFWERLVGPGEENCTRIVTKKLGRKYWKDRLRQGEWPLHTRQDDVNPILMFQWVSFLNKGALADVVEVSGDDYRVKYVDPWFGPYAPNLGIDVLHANEFEAVPYEVYHRTGPVPTEPGVLYGGLEVGDRVVMSGQTEETLSKYGIDESYQGKVGEITELSHDVLEPCAEVTFGEATDFFWIPLHILVKHEDE